MGSERRIRRDQIRSVGEKVEEGEMREREGEIEKGETLDLGGSHGKVEKSLSLRSPVSLAQVITDHR